MDRKLIELAIAAKDNSYSPYSKFRVGAAIKLDDGSYIQGSNIENAGFSATNCAERSALFTAYSQGYKKSNIMALAVTSDMKAPISPCGVCRQVLLELVNSDCPIFMVGQEEIIKTTIDELVPYQFTDKELEAGKR